MAIAKKTSRNGKRRSGARRATTKTAKYSPRTNGQRSVSMKRTAANRTKNEPVSRRTVRTTAFEIKVVGVEKTVPSAWSFGG